MNKEERLTALWAQWGDCRRCGLYSGRTNVVMGFGSPNAQIMIIGEAPGANEDKQGLPFVGQAGRLLDQYLAQLSARPELPECYDDVMHGRTDPTTLRNLLWQDFYFTNVVACRPPENRDPSPKEIEACSPRLHELIYTIDPLIIVAMGSVSIQALTGKKIGITASRGEVFDITIQKGIIPLTYPMIAVFHPAYLMRKSDFNNLDGDCAKTFDDILKALKIVDELNWRHYGIPHPEARPKSRKEVR